MRSTLLSAACITLTLTIHIDAGPLTCSSSGRLVSNDKCYANDLNALVPGLNLNSGCIGKSGPRESHWWCIADRSSCRTLDYLWTRGDYDKPQVARANAKALNDHPSFSKVPDIGYQWSNYYGNPTFFFAYGSNSDCQKALPTLVRFLTKVSDGGSCSSLPPSCKSGNCKGGKCCGTKGKSTGCTKCDHEGDCAACSSGYSLASSWVCEVSYCTTESGKCTSDSACKCQSSGHAKFTEKTSSGETCYSCGVGDGGACSSSVSCNSNLCRGNNCCNANGRSDGCTDCNADGDCSVCSSSFYLGSKKCIPKKANGETCGSLSPIDLSGGNDNSAKDLLQCTGECDNDGQCAVGLKCFQREKGESIPGCSGNGGGKTWDYCHDPNRADLVFADINKNGNGAGGLSECQGDCDKDSDCASGLKCFQRGAGNPGPLDCAGSPNNDGTGWDYCYRPDSSHSATCSSGICRGNNCCSSKGSAEGCTNCGIDGDCTECGSGFYLSAYTCKKMGSNGGSCSTGDTCTSGDCRGGNCCGQLGQTTGCTDCDNKGDCATCSSNYFLDQKMCFATTTTTTVTTATSTTATKTTTTTTTTTTTSTKTTSTTTRTTKTKTATTKTRTTNTKTSTTKTKTTRTKTTTTKTTTTKSTTTKSSTTTSITSATTTTTTTIYDPGDVDCIEQQDRCTAACETGTMRNYKVLQDQNKMGKSCDGPKDCKPGEDECPATTTATTTTASTTTATVTTVTLTTATATTTTATMTTITATTITATTRTVSTTTTTTGKLTPEKKGKRSPNCNYKCTHHKFHNNVCDPECNNYDCRYDHGACSREMSAFLSRARTLSMVGNPSVALGLFENVCDALATPHPDQNQISNMRTDLTVELECSHGEGSQSDGKVSVQFLVGRKWQQMHAFFDGIKVGETRQQTFIGAASATRMKISTSSADAIGYWRIAANGRDLLRNQHGRSSSNNAYWLGLGVSSKTFELPVTDAAEVVELGNLCKDGRFCKHGSCNEDGGSSGCTCYSGWTGTTCESNIDDCKKDSCSYDSHGFCIDGIDDFTCNCKPGWSGRNCQIKGCNIVDAVGFNHTSFNTRFKEDTAKLQNGKPTFLSADGQHYIFWCQKNDFYLVGSVLDWVKNSNGDCVGLAYTTPSKVDFRKEGVMWNELGDASWQLQASARVSCGSSCPVVDVDGFNDPIINDRFTEDVSRVQNGRPTYWSYGNSYIYWCPKNSVYVVGFLGSWNENEAGSCYGAAMTAPGANLDFRNADWNELDDEAGFILQVNATVACATGAGADTASAFFASSTPLPLPSDDLCARDVSAKECDESHDLLVNDYNAQQFFAITSCISAKNLRDSGSVDGASNAVVGGDFSWSGLQSNMEAKLEMLASMDDEISRIEELAAKHNAMSDAALVGQNLEAFQSSLKALVGESVAHIEDAVAKQTREMEELAKKNKIQLNAAASLQRKTLADALREQDGVDELESEVDSITEDIDLLLHSMASLEERIDYLHKYGASSKDSGLPYWELFSSTTEKVSITQRILLVQAKRHNESWGGLTRETQTVLSEVLANATQVNALNSDQLTALNAAMLFESESAAAFTLLDPEAEELTPSQKRTLNDMRHNVEMSGGELDSPARAKLEGLLDGTMAPRSLSKDDLVGLNEAMEAQRILTGFSMTWDEDGNGIVDPPEKVAVLMDMAWPDSTDEGKVLSLFRTANADVGAPRAREAIVKHLGENAGTIFDNYHDRRKRARRGGSLDDVIDASLDTIVAFAQAKAKETAIEAHGEEGGEQRSNVASPAIDLVKAVVVGQKWADAAIPVAEIATEVFGDKKYAPLAKEALKQTKRFLEASARAAASPAAAAGGWAAAQACDYTKNEYVCDMNSCINVGFDVGTNIVKGATYGGKPGAIVGAGLALAKAAFSGDLKACANGIIKVGGKLVKLAKKFIPVAVEKTVTAIKKAPVFKIAKQIVTAPKVRAAARYTYNGINNYVAPLARHVENFGRNVWGAMSQGYDYVEEAAYYVGETLSQGYDYVEKTVHYVGKTVSQGYNYVGETVSQGYNYVVDTMSQGYNYVVDTGKKMLTAATNAVTDTACEWTGWFCRRRRWRRGTPALEYNTSDIDPMLELLADAGMLAAASKTVYDNADGLFFNTSKGVPIDMGPLVHPDIEAKYHQQSRIGKQGTAALFTEALAAYQTSVQKNVELDARIETSRFMTENIAAYLLDEDHDLQDQVELALQLMRSRREETVFQILEQASGMNKAYQFKSLQPKLESNLPDSPDLADLQQLYGNLSDSYSSATTEAAAQTIWDEGGGIVYFTFNESTSPDAFRELNQTGSTYFTIYLSEGSKYRKVRLVNSTINAYMYPIDRSKLNNTTTATIEVSKGRFSSFLSPTAAEPLTFLHTNTSMTTQFQYDAVTCMPVAAAVPCPSPRCGSDFLGSPSGEWKISVPKEMQEALLPAKNLRLAFNVQWLESSAGSSSEYTEEMFENDPCDEPTCFLSPTSFEPIVHRDACSTTISSTTTTISSTTTAVTNTSTTTTVSSTTFTGTSTTVTQTSTSASTTTITASSTTLSSTTVSSTTISTTTGTGTTTSVTTTTVSSTTTSVSSTATATTTTGTETTTTLHPDNCKHDSSVVTWVGAEKYYDTAHAVNFGPSQWTPLLDLFVAYSDPLDACRENSITLRPNTVLIVERGSCDFWRKIVNGQNAGAAAVIVVNSMGSKRLVGTAFGMKCSDGAPQCDSIAIPSVFIERPSVELKKGSKLDLTCMAQTTTTSTTYTSTSVTSKTISSTTTTPLSSTTTSVSSTTILSTTTSAASTTVSSTTTAASSTTTSETSTTMTATSTTVSTTSQTTTSTSVSSTIVSSTKTSISSNATFVSSTIETTMDHITMVDDTYAKQTSMTTLPAAAVDLVDGSILGVTTLVPASGADLAGITPSTSANDADEPISVEGKTNQFPDQSDFREVGDDGNVTGTDTVGEQAKPGVVPGAIVGALLLLFLAMIFVTHSRRRLHETETEATANQKTTTTELAPFQYDVETAPSYIGTKASFKGTASSYKGAKTERTAEDVMFAADDAVLYELARATTASDEAHPEAVYNSASRTLAHSRDGLREVAKPPVGGLYDLATPLGGEFFTDAHDSNYGYVQATEASTRYALADSEHGNPTYALADAHGLVQRSTSTHGVAAENPTAVYMLADPKPNDPGQATYELAMATQVVHSDTEFDAIQEILDTLEGTPNYRRGSETSSQVNQGASDLGRGTSGQTDFDGIVDLLNVMDAGSNISRRISTPKGRHPTKKGFAQKQASQRSGGFKRPALRSKSAFAPRLSTGGSGGSAAAAAPAAAPAAAFGSNLIIDDFDTTPPRENSGSPIGKSSSDMYLQQQQHSGAGPSAEFWPRNTTLNGTPRSPPTARQGRYCNAAVAKNSKRPAVKG